MPRLTVLKRKAGAKPAALVSIPELTEDPRFDQRSLLEHKPTPPIAAHLRVRGSCVAQACAVFGSPEALLHCILAPTGGVWDSILRTYLLHVYGSGGREIVNVLRTARKDPAHVASQQKRKDLRKKLRERKKQVLEQQKGKKKRQLLLSLGSSSSSSGEEEEEDEQVDASGASGAAEKVVVGGGEENDDDDKNISPTSTRARAAAKNRVNKGNDCSKLKRADMILLARKFPIYFWCDPRIDDADAEGIQMAYQSEGMNFVRTPTPEKAFVVFYALEELQQFVERENSGGATTTASPDSTISSTSSGEAGEGRVPNAKVRRLESESMHEDGSSSGASSGDHQSPREDVAAVVDTPMTTNFLLPKESVIDAGSSAGAAATPAGKAGAYPMRPMQVCCFVATSTARGVTKGKTKPVELSLFGNRVYVGAAKDWPEIADPNASKTKGAGESGRGQAVDDFVGVPGNAGALFYPDGCVESCHQKILLVRNGRKNERPMLLCTALERGLYPGQGPVRQTARWIARVQKERRMAFTGAGISAESGVPTYRDPGGLWSFYDPEEVSSIKGFALDPRKVWAFEVEFFKLLRKVTWNPAHRALSALDFRIVTQNVDGLHQAAGSEKVIEVHGSEVRAICLRCKKTIDMSVLVDQIVGDRSCPKEFRMQNNMADFIEDDAAPDEEAEKCDRGGEDQDAANKKTQSCESAEGGEASPTGAGTAGAGAALAAVVAADKKQKTKNSSSGNSSDSSTSSAASGLFGEKLRKGKKMRKKADRSKAGDYDRLHRDATISELSKKTLMAYAVRCREKTKKKKGKKNKSPGSGSEVDGDKDGKNKKRPAAEDGSKTSATESKKESKDAETENGNGARTEVKNKKRSNQHRRPVHQYPVGVLKPDGIYFGEALERTVLKGAIRTAMTSDVVLMVGTTGKVDPARQMPLLAKAHNGAKVVEVNPNPTLLSKVANLVIREPSARVLPWVQEEVDALTAGGEVVVTTRVEDEDAQAEMKQVISNQAPENNAKENLSMQQKVT
eukprot:g15904.t1